MKRNSSALHVERKKAKYDDVRMVLDPFLLQIEQHLIMSIAMDTEVYYFAPGQKLFEVVGPGLVIANLISEGE